MSERLSPSELKNLTVLAHDISSPNIISYKLNMPYPTVKLCLDKLVLREYVRREKRGIYSITTKGEKVLVLYAKLIECIERG